jgi:putative intracellular protease/amidase
MNAPRRLVVIAVMSFIVTFATSAAAATSTIGILVFNGFLTSDVTAPVEVFGAATKKHGFHHTK